MSSQRWSKLLGVVAAGVAFAASESTSLAEHPAAPALEADRESDARAHFERGVELLERDAWGEALTEFLASRRIYPRATATTNAVICLRRLGRYDEALDLIEALLREFPDLPADKRAAAEAEAAELAKLVGAIVIESAEPGATIEIDGRLRGTSPAPGPLRVAAGVHTVRVAKEGFSRSSVSVEVAAGQVVRIVLNLRELRRTPLASSPTGQPTALPVAPLVPTKGGSYAPGVIALSAGGAGLVIGAATGAVALIKASHVRSQCTGDMCPASAQEEANASRMLGSVSTASFIIGGLATATGVVLLVIRSRDSSTAAASAHAAGWHATIGLGHIELGGRF